MRRVNVRKGKVPTSREQWKLEKYILKRLQKNPMTSTELLQEFEFGTVSELRLLGSLIRLIALNKVEVQLTKARSRRKQRLVFSLRKLGR
jgi:hypothetical protein